MPWNGSSSFALSPVTSQANITEILPSGETSGATDTGRIQAAVSALGGGPGAIILAPGQFYWTAGAVVVTNPGVYIYGAGRWATIINGSGTGDIIRMYSPVSYPPGGGGAAGGGVIGLTVDGSSCGAGSSGIHAGDIYNLEMNCGVRHFQGAGSKNFWFDNQYTFTEHLWGRIWAENGTSNVVFDNSANLLAATNSFARAILDIMLDCKGAGHGVVLQNGAEIYDGRVGIYGNIDYGASLHYVLNLTGTGSGGTGSRIISSLLNIGVECNGTIGVQPVTINFNTAGTNNIRNCTGVIDFSAANALAGAANAGGSFQFDGPVLGDANLKRVTASKGAHFSNGAIGNNAFITTRYLSYATAAPAGNVTGAILEFNDNDGPWGDATFTLVNQGAGSITFDVPATSHVATGTSCVIQPGMSMTFTYISNSSTWYQVT